MKKLFSIFGGLFMVSACTAYFFQIRNGSSIPNPATLFLWILIDTVNLISYFFTTGKDNWKSLTAYVATILAFFMFIYSLVFGKFAGNRACGNSCISRSNYCQLFLYKNQEPSRFKHDDSGYFFDLLCPSSCRDFNRSADRKPACMDIGDNFVCFYGSCCCCRLQ